MWRFESERPFNLYDYLVSHSELLIRSQKDKGFDDNIDVIFTGTAYVQLPAYMNGLTITRPERFEIETLRLDIPVELIENNSIFELKSEGKSHFIAAGFVQIFSNQLDHSQTSLGFNEVGRQRLITSYP